MTDHTPITQSVAPLPDSVKVTQAIAMLDDLRTEAKYLTKLQKENNQQLRELTNRINKLAMMLEAK